MIDVEYLKKIINYDKETGDISWRIKKRGPNKVGVAIRCLDNSGYIMVGIDQKRYRGHRIAWLYEYGYWPENNIDHINGNRSDNRIVNLRETSQVCNLRNTGNFKNSKSGVRGVCWDNARSMWTARIVINSIDFYICRSKDFVEAVCARLVVEQCVGWGSCINTSPAKKYVSEVVQCQK